MIDNYRKRKQASKIKLIDKEGLIKVEVERFKDDTGESYQFNAGTTNVKHLDALIDDGERHLEELKNQSKELKDHIDDLKALRADVKAIEDAREPVDTEEEEVV